MKSSKSSIYGGAATAKLDRTSTNFSYAVNEALRQIKWGDNLDFLKYYQNIVRGFLAEVDTHSRGLLIYHGMGIGKSMLAMSIAMDTLVQMPSMPIILLLAKSLQSNMRQSIYKYIAMRSVREPEYPLGHLAPADLEKWIDKNFRFVSINSNNMISQVQEALTGESGNAKRLDGQLARINELPSLDGRLLIVDEAHVLFRSITNGSENALRLYESIIASRTVRVLFCTGTPMASHPFELVPCFNMLAASPGAPLLPEQFEDFMRLFVDSAGGKIKNAHLLQNRIMGLVSHITVDSTPGAGVGRPSSSADVQFPELMPLQIRHVPMEARQWGAYTAAREREQLEGFAGKSAGRSMVKPKGLKSSTYRTKSRQISNYFATSVHPAPGEITSPKFQEIIGIMAASPLSIVYSGWVHTGGIEPFSKFLRHNGWRMYGSKSGSAAGRTFAVLTNEIPAETRDEIIVQFNSLANAHGELIASLVLSKVAAVGIDLRGVRDVILMEPTWKMGDTDQIIYRAVRNGSHTHLPVEERRVTATLVLSIPPPGELEPGSLPPGITDITTLSDEEQRLARELGGNTTDVDIFTAAKRTEGLIRGFATAIENICIECLHNKSADCYTCAPTGERLFTPGPGGWWRDEVLPNPCRQTLTQQIQVESIPGGDPAIRYRVGGPLGYELFLWDEKLGQFFPLAGSDPRLAASLQLLHAAHPGGAAGNDPLFSALLE